MAAKASKGSIILEILIVLMALLLVAVILIPNRIWKEENQITDTCRNNMNTINEAELFYYRTNDAYSDTLTNLLNYVQADSALKQRQALVSLTQSFKQVLNNILGVPAIGDISSISQATDEITGDLMGNDRYFRKYQNIFDESNQIMREMNQIDSSQAFPNFSKTKVFVDSLRNLRDKVSDYVLQNAVLEAINFTDSISFYFEQSEFDNVNEFWKNEATSISNLISDIKNTDIVKISSVSDRLQKFADRINVSMAALQTANIEQNKTQLASERQNLGSLHEKFLSPDYFMLTKRYAMSSLNETDSILIHFDPKMFVCPDDQKPYIIDTTGGRQLTIECPNLLDRFHEKFVETVQPISNLQLYGQMDQLDTVITKTKAALNQDREVIRRNTDLLLQVKELLVEMDNMSSIFFYRYVNELQAFVKLIDQEKMLSVLKPSIEEVLNPMDTLATRIENKDLNDLSQKIDYFNSRFSSLDSAIAALRMPSRSRRQVVNISETFQPASNIIDQMRAGFDAAEAKELRAASEKLEKDLLNALEGVNQTEYVIFQRTHINHGYIKDGEKSWEQK